MTVRLDQADIDWINENLPRRVSVSEFARQAIQAKIADERARSHKT